MGIEGLCPTIPKHFVAMIIRSRGIAYWVEFRLCAATKSGELTNLFDELPNNSLRNSVGINIGGIYGIDSSIPGGLENLEASVFTEYPFLI